jgi:hypothetical protein
MASSINFASLTQYTDQLSTPLLHESILQGKTIGLISTQVGVKYADALNLMTSTLVAQAGGCGAISPTGSVTLSQRSLTACPIKIEEAICIDQMEQYWLGMSMKKGSWYENTPEVFNQAYNADKVAKIQQLLDYYAWEGDTGAAYSANYTLCNGFLNICENGASASVIRAGATYSGAITATNAIAVVDAMCDALATSVPGIMDLEDLTLFMNYPQYRTYVRALRTANLYHFNALESEGSLKYEIYHPGTNVKIVATVGLSDTSKMILTSAKNLYFGTDLTSDTDQYTTWFELRDNQLYFRAKFKIAFQIAYPQYVVIYKA